MGGRHPSSHLQLPPNSSGRSSGLKYSQSLCSSELLSTTHLALVLGSKKILAIFHITGNTLKSCGKYKWNGRQLGEKMKSANLIYHIRTILCTLTLKVAEHSFGSLWVYVICQIMARERLQLTSWNLASEKYTDERFWLTGKMWRFHSFHGNMNDWIQP